jgi:hypothetical protein
MKDKFCYLIADSLGLEVQNRAHSGATVLSGSGPDDLITRSGYSSPVASGVESATGEVPRSKPTILEQAASFVGNPNSVGVILVDGGINDVTLKNILDLSSPIQDLDRSIRQHCHREMVTLLKYIVARFSHSSCRIVVTGYFPILSRDSCLVNIPLLLKLLRVKGSRKARSRTASDLIVDRALRFWHESDRLLAKSVKDVNDPRVRFVRSGFNSKNALFATDPLLREPNVDPCLPHPQFPVYDSRYDQRGVECKHYPQDLENCLFCPIASLGHPLERGAQTYFNAIVPRL